MFGSWAYIFLLQCLFASYVQNYEVEHLTEGITNTRGIKGGHTCGENALGNVTATFFTGCDWVPCHIKPKTTYYIYIEGILDKDHDTLTAAFGAQLSGVVFKAVRVNACDQLVDGQKCPLKKGRKYLFGLALNTDILGSNLANLRTFHAIADIRDPLSKDTFCAVIPVVVDKAK